MTPTREGRQRRGTDNLAASPFMRSWPMAASTLAALPLAGCGGGVNGGPADSGAWGFVTVAFLVAVLGAFLLGRARARLGGRPQHAPSDTVPLERPPQEGARSALQAAFDAHPQPWAVATEAPTGWCIDYLNRAGAEQWPGLQTGGDLAALPLGPDLQPAAGSTLRVLPLPEPDPVSGARRLLLTAPTAAEIQREARHSAEQATARETERESASFSFTVSHDLRAPIRVVEGFTRIVKEDYGRQLDRVGNDHLERVLGAAARMNLMIDALLTLARLSEQPLGRQPVNLSQLAAYVIDDLRKSSPEREAEIEIEPGLLAQGDPTLLRLVLENLLGNAWKYSQRSPRTLISLASVPHEGGRAFVVRDNGAGFDMRSAERLFGIFQRLHSVSEYPGHGVGLASVRRIVRRHGGQIWAEAEPGRGAAFFFTLAP